jgi:hypothetical protein
MVPPCAPSFLSRHCEPRLGSRRARPGSARKRTLYTGTVWGVSSAGRAPALQAGGHRFDPGTLHLGTRWKTAGSPVQELAGLAARSPLETALEMPGRSQRFSRFSAPPVAARRDAHDPKVYMPPPAAWCRLRASGFVTVRPRSPMEYDFGFQAAPPPMRAERGLARRRDADPP